MTVEHVPSLRRPIIRHIERLLGLRILRPAELANLLQEQALAQTRRAELSAELANARTRLEATERAIAELAPANERNLRDSQMLAQQVEALTRRLGEQASRDVRPTRFPFPSIPGIDPSAFEVHVVDVGAEPLDFETDIYEPILRSGRHRVVGFDPFVDNAVTRAEGEPGATARAYSNPLVERVTLPYFIADGQRRRFHVNRFSPTSSLYPSNTGLLSQFSHLERMCETMKTIEVDTRRLDEVSEIERCDFLKIDVQGAEHDVLAHGRGVLSNTLFVHLEAEFAPIYANQPLFSEIELLLREQGFELIDFYRPGWNNYSALPSDVSKSRLLWADCIFMQSAQMIARRHPNLLLRAAYIAHCNYGKYDLAAHLIRAYDLSSRTNHLQAYRGSFLT